MAINPSHTQVAEALSPTNDHRPNSGMREGDVSHAEVNAALGLFEKTVIFGQQNRLRNGVLMADKKLTRFHAGHELVRFFYQGMNKLPEYLLDALLTYNVSVTLISDKDLLIFKDVRNHQALHVGYTRKTIYMPEGVVREAIYKGWDSWAIAEAVIREAWPLMDYLLIYEFIRRAQLRLRSFATLGSQTVIEKALKILNKHLIVSPNNNDEEDDFGLFFRHYCKAFFAIDRKVLKEDPYERTDLIFDERQERKWSDLKVYDITTELDYPSYFDLDRDIVHPAAYRAADIRNEPIEPESVDDILHDIHDAARFRILRQTKTMPLLDKLFEHGYHGIEGIARFLTEDRASERPFLTVDLHDNTNVLDLFKGKLQEYSTSAIEGLPGSISNDFNVLMDAGLKGALHAEYKRFLDLPKHIQLKSKEALRQFAFKAVRCLGNRQDLFEEVQRATRLPQIDLVVDAMVGKEPKPVDPTLIQVILKKLDRHPLYHYLIRDQMRELTGNQSLRLGKDIREQVDTLYKSMPDQPYRWSSDPAKLRIYLKDYERLRKADPNSRKMFSFLAGIFIRLDKSEKYEDLLAMIRPFGKEARPVFEEAVKELDPSNAGHRTIMMSAESFLMTIPP